MGVCGCGGVFTVSRSWWMSRVGRRRPWWKESCAVIFSAPVAELLWSCVKLWSHWQLHVLLRGGSETSGLSSSSGNSGALNLLYLSLVLHITVVECYLTKAVPSQTGLLISSLVFFSLSPGTSEIPDSSLITPINLFWYQTDVLAFVWNSEENLDASGPARDKQRCEFCKLNMFNNLFLFYYIHNQQRFLILTLRL